uniref:Uncharacterized protein n=1 Tax=Anguilla anguilla TaxID=7936 RepID=A0A0E9PAB5_ANGAN
MNEYFTCIFFIAQTCLCCWFIAVFRDQIKMVKDSCGKKLGNVEREGKGIAVVIQSTL